MIDESSQSSTTITIAGNKQTTELIEQGPKDPDGAKSWTRQDQGPWVEREPKDQPSLFETIEALSGIEDVGVVMKDGKPLHHLQAKGGNEISPEALGFDIEGATDPSFTLDLYATEDGTPAIIAVNGSWSQDNERDRGARRHRRRVRPERAHRLPVDRPAAGPVDALHLEALQVRDGASGGVDGRVGEDPGLVPARRPAVRLRRARAQGGDDDDRPVRRLPSRRPTRPSSAPRPRRRTRGSAASRRSA